MGYGWQTQEEEWRLSAQFSKTISPLHEYEGLPAVSLGAALVGAFDSTAMIGDGVHSGPSSRKFAVPEMTTKAAPSSRTQKAAAISSS